MRKRAVRTRHWPSALRIAIAIAATGVLAACGREQPTTPPKADAARAADKPADNKTSGTSPSKGTAAPPVAPVDVSYIVAEPRTVPLVADFVGQTESSRQVEIRARVDGFLDKQIYTDGQVVKTGQPMFQMDAKPFQAQLAAAKAELAQQQARVATARANLARVKPLAEENAVSKKDLDDSIGQEQAAAAAVEAAKAKVETAQLNLGYTRITSPVTGLSSFAKQQEGSYINAQNSLLTYVAQLSPLWVNFSLSENEVLRFQQEMGRGEIVAPKDQAYAVEIVLADGTLYPRKGRITFADASFSKETGTFMVRAEIPNPDGTLRPGQFVRVHVLGLERPNSIVLPQRAVQQGPRGTFVWVVNAEDKAEQRLVDVGQWIGGDWLVKSGLNRGDRIVSDGTLRLAPGVPLHATAAPPPAASAAKPPVPGVKTAPIPIVK